MIAFIKDDPQCKYMFRPATTEELSTLLREVVLPEMTRLRGELEELRIHTWPYVQALKEINQMDDIQAKRHFASYLDDDTLLELLRLKAKHSRSGGGSILREFDIIRKNCPSGTS